MMESQFLKNSITNGIDVHIQSQTSQLFQYFLLNEQKTDITLTSAVEEDDTVINVSAGHGFTAATGEMLVIRNGDAFAQLSVVSVATNAITVDVPVAIAFPITSGVMRGNNRLNVNGSVTPVEFKCGFTYANQQGAETPIDVGHVILSMQHAAEGDDGKFGGIAALTNGLYFRKQNTANVNLGNYQNNQKFRELGAAVTYPDKAPAGVYATAIDFSIEEKFGQVLRLDPGVPDCLLATVRDNLSGLAYFTASILGSFTEGE